MKLTEPQKRILLSLATTGQAIGSRRAGQVLEALRAKGLVYTVWTEESLGGYEEAFGTPALTYEGHELAETLLPSLTKL